MRLSASDSALNNGAQSATEKSNVWCLKKRNISYENMDATKNDLQMS